MMLIIDFVITVSSNSLSRKFLLLSYTQDPHNPCYQPDYLSNEIIERNNKNYRLSTYSKRKMIRLLVLDAADADTQLVDDVSMLLTCSTAATAAFAVAAYFTAST